MSAKHPTTRRLDHSILAPTQPAKLTARDASGRDINFGQQQPIPAPPWARELIDAINANADALNSLAASRSGVRRILDFTTVDPVESSFPLFMAFDSPPDGLSVVHPRNMTDLTSLFYEGVSIHFDHVPGGVTIRYISGLTTNTRYRLKIEVSGA